MPTLRERIENNLPVFFLATLATGFAAGFGTYRAIQEASNIVPVRQTDLDRLKREAVAANQTNPLPEPAQSQTAETTASAVSLPHSSEQQLDGTVPVVSAEKDCWAYVNESISIGGQLMERYATLDHRCDENEALTFDVRGWSRFEGFVGVPENDSRANNLTIKVDGEKVTAMQVFYNKAPQPINIDLTGHKTLTFEKSGRYPLVVVAEPRLIRN